jgi:hypothetical protein
MAKGQKRSGREPKKPKANKPAAKPAAKLPARPEPTKGVGK